MGWIAMALGIQCLTGLVCLFTTVSASLASPLVVVDEPTNKNNICWTHGYLGYFLPEYPMNVANQWPSLEAAKTWCDSVRDCGGVTHTRHQNLSLVYEARRGFSFLPSTSEGFQETSFLKVPCDLWNPRLWDPQPSVTPDFFHPQFTCENSALDKQKQALRPIERIWVWGERNSGTGMIQRLLSFNFNLTQEPIGGLPWKHGFMSQQYLDEMESTLNVFMVKDPYAWINSMKRNPFHAPMFKDVSWPTFMTHEWWSEMDSVGEVDRNPETWHRFDNILQLRSAKLRDWLKVRECLPYHYTLRYEDLIQNVSQALLDIADQFQSAGLKLRNTAISERVCIVHYGECVMDYDPFQIARKQSYYLDREYLKEIPPLVKPYITRNLDTASEKLVGYNFTTDFAFTYRTEQQQQQQPIRQTLTRSTIVI